MPDQLLSGETVDHYRRAVAQGAERVAARLLQTDAPFTGVPPEPLEATIAGIDLDAPLADSGAALDELERIYLRDAVYFHHPRYLAHLNCPVAIPALLAETILAPINSSLDTWDQSGGGTLIEQRLIAWTAARIGLGPDADGVFTSGGTQSNLQALHIARDELQADPERLRVLVSEAGHFSIAKAAVLLGLPEEAVIGVPCDAAMRMRPDALRAAARRLSRGGASCRWPSSPRPGRPTSAASTRSPRSPTPAATTACGCTSTPPTAAGCSSRAAARH